MLGLSHFCIFYAVRRLIALRYGLRWKILNVLEKGRVIKNIVK